MQSKVVKEKNQSARAIEVKILNQKLTTHIFYQESGHQITTRWRHNGHLSSYFDIFIGYHIKSFPLPSVKIKT